MKYDSGMTHFNKDIIAALQYMLKDNSEIAEKFSPKDGSLAPLRDYLKQKYGKLRESHIGDGMHYSCNAAKGFELTFDIILNNPGDKNLTLSWSQVTKFIRDNWDEVFKKEKTICDDCINNDENCIKPLEDKCIGYTSKSDTVLNSTPESKPTYKDIFLEHYPNFDVSRFDEFISSDCRYACAAEYFTDTDPFDCNNPQSCKKCWYSPCESNWNSPDDNFVLEDISDYLKTVTVPENESPEEITDDRKMNIIYIGVNEIEPHPNNPRKDVGDVSELSEDIKENGIRQNLTVIPYEQGYRCLIGHRRLAAAKLAGLDKVPCAVENAGMSLSDQICIMLSENIQRADLTPIEQAESMQMMLDMGDTVDYISRKTGLSKSTVYRRINPIKEYGIETCKKAYEHGATFEDFSKLDEITDPRTRDRLAKTLGTSNFEYQYRNAVEDEKRNEKLNEVKESIKSFAEEISDDKKAELKYIDYISGWSASNFKKPDDTDTVKYFYSIDDRGNVQICREYTPDELKDREQKKAENSAFEEKRRRTEERRAELKKRTDIAAELRHKFVTQFDPLKGCNSQKEQLARYKTVLEFWALTYISFDFEKVDTLEYFINNVGMDVTEEFYEMETETQSKTIEPHIKKSRNWELKTLFDIMIAVLETYTLKYYNDYYLTYNECPALDMIYEILCSFGYEMSDEEKKLQDGSHELFTEGD